MKKFESSLREFAWRGEVTAPYSDNEFCELLTFAKAFYPSIAYALRDYSDYYFGEW